MMIDEFWYSTDKLQLMNGYKQLCRNHGATHLATFVFNQEEPDIEYAQYLMNKWHRIVDKQLFGGFYHKRQRCERTSFIAVPENKLTNLHYHAILVTPKPQEFEAIAPTLWKKLVPAGNLDLGYLNIDDEQREKYVNYIDYELMCENNMDLVFLSKANPSDKMGR